MARNDLMRRICSGHSFSARTNYWSVGNTCGFIFDRCCPRRLRASLPVSARTSHRCFQSSPPKASASDAAIQARTRRMGLRQRLVFGAVTFTAFIALLQHNDVVPITHRVRHFVIPEGIEHAVSPVIQRFKESQLAISDSQGPDDGFDFVASTMTRLQQSLGRSRWKAVIVEEPSSMYAICGQNDTVYLSRPMLRFCRDEDELAFVLGHELSHGLARHRWEVAGKLSIYALVAPVLGQLGGMLLTTIYGLSIIRTNEYEADEMALKLMASAGYNPAVSIHFLRKIQGLSYAANQTDGVLGKIKKIPVFKTHPPTDLRISRLEKQCFGHD